MRPPGSAFATYALLLGVSLPAPARGETPPKAAPLAEVDGVAITEADVEKAVGMPLARLQEQIYNLKRQKLEGLVSERLLAAEAARRGVAVAVLLEAEVNAKVPPVTDEEIAALFPPRKTGASPAQEATARAKAQAGVRAQRLATRREEFVKRLREAAKVVIHLTPPPPGRVDVPHDGGPVRGAAFAPVTIVEFSDFQCPFCRTVQPTLELVLSRYEGKVRLVYRDFPLAGLHERARPAAEAAHCAGDQGRFWPYHDALYAGAAELLAEQLMDTARRLGLDMAVFEACVAARAHRDAVQRELDDGARFGVTRTPTFFINGRPLSGAQPFEGFARIIDEELAGAQAVRSESGAKP
jgi:protein-disulfide isomerase